MNLQQQITARGTNTFNPTQAPPVIPHAQQYLTAQQIIANAYGNEARNVVGIPASAMSKPIVPRSHDLTHSNTSQLRAPAQDPNLQCVLCGKIFKIGQMQNFKRHVATCTGSD